MRKFLAGLLGMVLCVQTVYGIPGRAADVFESGERPKAMQDVIRQEDPEQTNRDNSGNLTGLELSAESAVIMEASGGQVLLEKNADEKKPPASVTKVMTLLLIFDALADGTITPDTEVTTSEYAASMGGSQVFLEAGEKQTVDTMIKCIAVASANDACVAMAEKIAGSEPAFVEKMNQRSAGLGMTNTHFVNCNGLDTEGHYSTAYDIALMSRELTVNYPEIFDYTSIWMEDITHHTARGDTSFTLNNTNHLIKQYPYATGLKTGFTSTAGFCLSATASKDGMDFIAVVLNAPSSKERMADIETLFEWGFANCQVYTDENLDSLPKLPVSRGRHSQLSLKYESAFYHLDTTNTAGELAKKIELPDSVEAPIKKGDIIGKAVYTLNDNTVGSVNLLASESIPLITLKDTCQQLLHRFFLSEPD